MYVYIAASSSRENELLLLKKRAISRPGNVLASFAIFRVNNVTCPFFAQGNIYELNSSLRRTKKKKKETRDVCLVMEKDNFEKSA